MKNLLFDEENVEFKQQEEIDLFLPVCEEYLKNNPFPTVPSNPLVFSQEALSQRPGMEWLSNVRCNLICPENKDIEKQEQQLNAFFQKIEKEASFLQKDFSEALSSNGFEGSKIIALDLEATGLDTRIIYDYTGELKPQVKIVGVCLATSDTEGYYLPVLHTEEDGIPNWNYSLIVNFLQQVIDSFLVIFHNAQYDKEVLSINGVKTREFPYFLDTMLLHFLSDVNKKRHNLKDVSEEILGRKMVEISQLFTEMGVKSKVFINFDKLPASNGFVYGCSDAMNTMGLFLSFAQVPNENNVFIQQPTPLTIDHKLVDTLRNMYRSGFPVNIDYAIQSSKDILYRLSLLKKKLFDFVGKEFDIQSPQQVSVVIYDEFKIPPLEGMVRGKPTKNHPQGLYSTDADTLDALYTKHPEISLLEYIVQYRQLCLAVNNVFSKLIANSYVDAFIPYTRSQAQYAMTVIPTGRLSSASNGGRSGVICNETKKGNVTYSYNKGDWSCGINTQGISKPDKKHTVARKITSLPKEAGLSLSTPYPKEIELELVKLISQI